MNSPQQQRQRRLWRRGQPRPLEESCRSVHQFATRHADLYPWRVRILIAVVLLTPVFTAAFLTAVALGLPWAFRESELLRPIYDEAVLRWATLIVAYGTMLPPLSIYLSGLLRGLTLRLPRPGGVKIEEDQAPRLFRLLAETCRSLDAPAVDEVRIAPDRVLEIQRQPCGAPGVLGRTRTVLIAGLPLLEELSPQHLRALVAHEVAHLATYKRRFGGRVLGLRARLAALRQATEESALGQGYWSRIPDETLLDILERMIGRLSAETFPAARQHEAEADAIAASIAGREFAVSALIRQRLAGHAVTQQFQAECLRLAERCAEPPSDLFERRAAAASGAFTESQVHGWLGEELKQKDDLAESHGPLWDRLRLLGYRLESLTEFQDLLAQIQPHRELGETAARFFLGGTAESLRAEFFRDWAAHQAADWRRRFEAYQKLCRTAAEWESGTGVAGETPEELWQIAVAVGNTRNWRAALPLAKRILEICPEHSDANLLAGQLQIEDGDATGIESLERAMRSDARITPAACTVAARFLEGRGERDAAAGYQKRCEEYRKCEQAVAQERGHVRSSDSFSPADCAAATADALRRALERHGSHIRAAYLVRKQVMEADRKPLYLLAVERRNLPYENTRRANRLLLERIVRVPGMPGDVLVCVVTRANRALLEKWKSVPQSLLYPCVRVEAADAARVAQRPDAGPAGLLREPGRPAPLPPQSSPAAAK